MNVSIHFALPIHRIQLAAWLVAVTLLAGCRAPWTSS